MSEKIVDFPSHDRIEDSRRLWLVGNRLRQMVSRRRFIACVEVLDFVTFLTMALIWFSVVAPNTDNRRWGLCLILAGLTATTTHCVLRSFQMYDFAVLTDSGKSIPRAVCAGVVAVLPLLILEMMHSSNGETTSLYLMVALPTLAFMVAGRFAIGKSTSALIKTGILKRRVYVVADNERAASSLTARLACTGDYSVIQTRVLGEDNGRAGQDLETVLHYIRSYPVELLLVSLSLVNSDRLLDVAHTLRGSPHNALLVPYFDGGDALASGLIGNLHHSADALENMLVFRLSHQPLTGWAWMVKDMQDRALALALLILVAPVMLAIALTIKLTDPGPVFFAQPRFGYGKTIFKILKFRTMRVKMQGTDPTKLHLTTRDDPRVTCFGRFLRKTSLDELPQLWNVIKGDMWIIGPRPHSPYATAAGQIYCNAVREYAARYRIKPGITGWAQVCGWRGPTETLDQLSNRVQHDLYYIENWSPLLDIKIFFKTLMCGFRHNNAF